MTIRYEPLKAVASIIRPRSLQNWRGRMSSDQTLCFGSCFFCLFCFVLFFNEGVDNEGIEALKILTVSI